MAKRAKKKAATKRATKEKPKRAAKRGSEILLASQHAVVTGAKPCKEGDDIQAHDIAIEFVANGRFFSSVFDEDLRLAIWDEEGSPRQACIKIHRTEQLEDVQVEITDVQGSLIDDSVKLAFSDCRIRGIHFDPLPEGMSRVRLKARVRPSSSLQAGQLDWMIAKEVFVTIEKGALT